MGTVQLHKKPQNKQNTHIHVQTVHLHLMFQECVMFMTVHIGVHILNLYNLIQITRFLLWWKFFGFLLEDFRIVLIFYLTARNETGIHQADTEGMTSGDPHTTVHPWIHTNDSLKSK